LQAHARQISFHSSPASPSKGRQVPALPPTATSIIVHVPPSRPPRAACARIPAPRPKNVVDHLTDFAMPSVTNSPPLQKRSFTSACQRYRCVRQLKIALSPANRASIALTSGSAGAVRCVENLMPLYSADCRSSNYAQSLHSRGVASPASRGIGNHDRRHARPASTAPLAQRFARNRDRATARCGSAASSRRQRFRHASQYWQK